ncbi:hypothetical protein G9C85_05210 [Halorubellus sp. JP-L1]|uniref:hypothetical protein n=1 Tax=Halorubellus sp. JP-L1 TaxID=2715753 RepID=UPI0014078E7D|nr:hypothetical protein [Halorubellus sp. JP-L1]NHN41035.1 hypothetical protein [Halorubellus sp. JP-L1]
MSLPVDAMVTGEREFYGSYGCPQVEYEEIFRMMDTGKLEPGRIVGDTVALEDVPGVVENLGEYDTVGIPVCTTF